MFPKKDDLFEYEEDASVAFIRRKNPSLALTDDEINYIIDLVYDYYESRGLLDENTEQEVDIVDDELTEYVAAQARKEAIYTLADDDIATVVQGELDYCESLGIFEN